VLNKSKLKIAILRVSPPLLQIIHLDLGCITICAAKYRVVRPF
jgi:hypothetical protein